MKSSDIFERSCVFNNIIKSGNHIYIGESDGFIEVNEGKIKYFPTRKIIDARGMVVSAYAKSNVQTLVGIYSGDLVQLSDGEVKKIYSPPGPIARGSKSIDRFHGIGEDFIVAVGNNGLILKFIDGQWSAVHGPTDVRLEAVWCKGYQEIYIGGWEGSIWKWDGDGRWEPLVIEANNPNEINFTDFAFFDGVLYVAAGQHGVFQLNNGKLTPINSIREAYITRLTTINSGLVGVGGLWGIPGSWLTHFDGNKWSSQKVKLNF